MKRDVALKALDDAFATRIDHMFQNLADSYAGSPNAKAAAQKHFADGLVFTRDALAFAEEKIGETFLE